MAVRVVTRRVDGGRAVESIRRRQLMQLHTKYQRTRTAPGSREFAQPLESHGDFQKDAKPQSRDENGGVGSTCVRNGEGCTGGDVGCPPWCLQAHSCAWPPARQNNVSYAQLELSAVETGTNVPTITRCAWRCRQHLCKKLAGLHRW
jgi:hypothetical protein